MARSIPDILVVGAGIIGMTAALALHRRGARVLVIDAGTPGLESTWAGGGIVSPTPPWGYPEPVDRLVARSRDIYPDLIDTLETATGIDCEYRRCGLLLLRQAMQGGDLWLRDHAHDTGAAGDFEPALADGDQPALSIPGTAQVRNPRLGRALFQYLSTSGVDMFVNTPARALWAENGVVRGVETAGGRIGAGRVVLACGAWTDGMLEQSGLGILGIEPVKGQILMFNPGRAMIRHIIADGRYYLIPRADGRILCGSTVERCGFDRRPSREACRELFAAAKTQLPALAEHLPEAHWAGLRPGIAGNIPAIGPYPGIRNLWISAGHYRNGLGMAPAAAELLVRLIESETEETIYSPSPDRRLG